MRALVVMALVSSVALIDACSGCDAPVATEGEGEGAEGEGEGEGEGEPDPDAPVVTIVSPDDGESFARGQSIGFGCTAVDPQDGDVPNGDIVWTSSIDGQLGIGATVQTAITSSGTHTIGCAATDSDGNVGLDTVDITIIDNFAPEVVIEEPADGSSFSIDQTITFRGSAIDVEDGALTGAALTWLSDGQPLGAGAIVTTALPLGDHTITFGATDSEGALGTTTIVVHVVDNLGPVCTIENPDDGDTIAKDSTTTFTASCVDPDGTGPIGNAAVSWSSDQQGSLGLGFTVTTAVVVAGPHVVTVCAEDTEDAAITGCDSITITVVSAPVVTITSPSNGDTVDSNAIASFSGTAIDDEDGALVPTWLDSVVGEFATGNAATLSLLAGKHTVTLTAEDSSGLIGADTIEIFATPGAAPFSSLFDTLPLSLGAAVDDLVFDAASGTLWASTNDGLFDVAPDLSAATGFNDGNSSIPSNQVNGVAVDANGAVLVATDGGIGVACDAATLAGCQVFGQDELALNTDNITAVIVLPDGRVVVGTAACMMFSSFEQNEHREYCDGDSGFRGDVVRDLAFDPSTNTVIVVTDNGVTRMTPGSGVDNAQFERIDLNVDGENVRAVAVAPAGELCFATNDGAITSVDNDTRRYDDNDGLPSNDVRDVAFDVITVNAGDRAICWAATDGGLGRIDPSLPTATSITTADGLATNDLRSIVVLPDHTKVIGTTDTVISYSGL